MVLAGRRRTGAAHFALARRLNTSHITYPSSHHLTHFTQLNTHVTQCVCVCVCNIGVCVCMYVYVCMCVCALSVLLACSHSLTKGLIDHKLCRLRLSLRPALALRQQVVEEAHQVQPAAGDGGSEEDGRQAVGVHVARAEKDVVHVADLQ